MKHPVKCQMTQSFYLCGVGREGGINGVGHIKKNGNCEVLLGLLVGVFVVSLVILRIENFEDFC